MNRKERALKLTALQERFAQMLEQVPHIDLLSLWDFEQTTPGYVPEDVEHFLGVASEGEVLLCRFALGVWTGKNEFDFDLFEAVKTLGPEYRGIIVEWLTDPFWP